jgi:hypothetical protein
VIKERFAVTQIRRLVIGVKEKRGAILKIAPENLRKVSNKARNIIAADQVSGANFKIAPVEH